MKDILQTAVVFSIETGYAPDSNTQTLYDTSGGGGYIKPITIKPPTPIIRTSGYVDIDERVEVVNPIPLSTYTNVDPILPEFENPVDPLPFEKDPVNPILQNLDVPKNTSILKTENKILPETIFTTKNIIIGVVAIGLIIGALKYKKVI
jgi:hypothetical protein